MRSKSICLGSILAVNENIVRLGDGPILISGLEFIPAVVFVASARDLAHARSVLLSFRNETRVDLHYRTAFGTGSQVLGTVKILKMT